MTEGLGDRWRGAREPSRRFLKPSAVVHYATYRILDPYNNCPYPFESTSITNKPSILTSNHSKLTKMKVLLVGATGNVGKYLIPALLARNHEVVAYIRNPTKLSPEATFKLGPESIVTGSALDSTAIKDAILSKDCDAVVNAAGLAPMTGFSAAGDFPEIFKTVVNAVVEAGEERVKQGKPVLRCWLMSGFGVLDSPKKPHLLVDL